MTFKFETTDFFGDEFEVHQCKECQTYGLHPFPTPAQLARAYDRDYYGSGEQKFSPVVEAIRKRGRNRRSRTIVKYLPKNGRVLDIGCSDGIWLSELSLLGDFRLDGIEIESEAAQRAKKNKVINLHIGDLTSLQLEAESYDAISMNHVYEHLANPKQVLEEANRLLKPGGVLMIAIPNIDSWQAKWFKGHWFHLDPPRHLFFQSQAVLTKHLNKLGFDHLKTHKHHFEFNPYGFQQSILNRFSKRREGLYEYLKGNHHMLNGKAWKFKVQKVAVTASLPFFTVLSYSAATLNKSGTIEMYFYKK